MTWIGNGATTFNGLEFWRTRPRAFIVEPDIEDTISDVALTYQLLIDDDLVAGGSWGDTAQEHQNHSGSGRGCLLGHPLSTSNFGKGITAGGAYNGSIKFPEIDCSQVAAGYEAKDVWRWPLYIPAGHDNLWVHIRASESLADASPAVSLYTTSFGSGADVSALTLDGDPAYNFGAGNDFWFAVSVTTPGALHVLGLNIDAGGTDKKISLYSVRAYPETWEAAGGAVPEELGAATLGTNGPIDVGSYTKIPDTMTAAGNSLNAFVTRNAAANGTYVFELVTGATIDGSAGDPGHTHNGTNSAAIGMSLQSVCLGWTYIVSGNSTVGFNTTEADAGLSPSYDTNSEIVSGSPVAKTAAITGIMVPDLASGTATTATLHWAAVLNDVSDVNAFVQASTSDAIADSPFDNTSGYSDGTASSGWVVLKGTVDANEGAFNWAKFQFYGDTDKGGETSLAFTGFCFWVTP